MKVQQFDNLFSEFSQKDLAKSLFILSTWNRNRAADLKIKYAYVCFLSCNSFSNRDKIQDFSDFSNFCKKLFAILPSFSMLEDFVPQGDWGEIKYYYKNNFRILYGSDLSWSYDLLTNFELLCSSIEKEIEATSGENPLNHLGGMLKLSDTIISSLKLNPSSDSYDVQPGHIEEPKEDYWIECSQFLDTFQNHFCSEGFINRFTVKVGSLDPENRELDIFVDDSCTGKLIRYMFIQADSLTIPVNPRWYISALIDSWGETFNEIRNSLNVQKPPIPIRIGTEFGRFISHRIRRDRINLLVSATNKDEKPDEFIFPFTVQSGDSLYLFCFLNPCLDEESLKKSFTDVHDGIESAKKRFSKELVIALHLDRHFIGYQGKNKTMTPKFVVVVPHFTTEVLSFTIPQNLDADVIFMEQLIGIFDELENADEFDDFIAYLNDNKGKTGPLIGSLDYYGSFRDSHSVLVEGAVEPTMISLDPHWGTDFRFRTLLEFWTLYPRINLFGHPRSWSVSREHPTRTRLIARSFLGSALYFEIGDTACYINAPFEHMDFQLASITNVVTECLEDYLSTIESTLKKHAFFQSSKKIQILVFPKQLVSNPKFDHLKHLESSANPFSVDHGVPERGWQGFRYVFDDSQMTTVLSGEKGRVGEIQIVKTLLDEIDSQVPDIHEYPNVIQKLEELSKGKPRYTVTEQQKRASFPDVVGSSKPKSKHFKLAKKTIAIEAKESCLEEGIYDLDEAKSRVDTLLKKVVSQINDRVKLYNISQAIPLIIEKTDALVHRDEMDSFHHKTAPNRDIAYDLGEEMNKQNREFTSMHRNYRYLIEKFVQLNPSGNERFDEEAFQQLVALIDWFLVFVSAGDQIFHGLFPTGLEINSDYRVDVIIPEEKRRETEAFGEYLMKRRVGSGIDPSDKVESPTPIHEYIDTVDSVFMEKKGFLFRDLIDVLQILAAWGYQTNEGEKTFYKATKKGIIKVCLEKINEAEEASVAKVIDFLILKPENLCKVIGKRDYPEIPIWEHYKRHSRYTIRPLIEIGEYIFWGSYSAMKTGTIWSGNIYNGMLPVDLEEQAIKDCLLNEKSKVEKELEKKAKEIVRRFTSLCEGNVYLHKRDNTQGYPEELGDFDVLAYIEDKNVVISVECKHIQQVFSLKDSRDLKEELFGKDQIEGSYVGKVIRRDTFLKGNLEKVANTLNWSIIGNTTVVSIFCSKQPYYWTFSPPVQVPINFLCIDELHDFVAKL